MLKAPRHRAGARRRPLDGRLVYAAFGIRHPGMARSLIIAAAGSGSDDPEEFRQTCHALADRLEREGGAGFADYGAGASRLHLKRKDPQAYKVFSERLSSHSPIGSANTMRGVQAGRPPIYVLGERDGGHSYPYAGDILRR